MKTEKENLIHDLLEGDSGREATLAAGSRILRHRRYWRGAGKAGVVTLLAAVAVVLLTKELNHPAVNQVSKRGQASPPPQVQALTDDQLLALFPNTPVGLASVSNGKKRLIFPRPGDEQRFITRL